MTAPNPDTGSASPRIGPSATFTTLARVRQRVAELLLVPGRLLLITDFDGTIAPIDPDPMSSRIDPLGRTGLRRLARIAFERPERLHLVVLSGRTALDVAGRVRVGGIAYLGNHGLESGVLPRRSRAERLVVVGEPALAPFAIHARAVGRAVAEELGDPGWLFVEDKGPSVAFHYRAALDPDGAARQIDAAIAAHERATGDGGLERFEGRRIIEFRPAGAGGKGAAVARLIDRVEPATALVLGDDRSDAEAFRVLAEARQTGRLAGSLAVAIHGSTETPVEIVAAADLLLETTHDAARTLSIVAGVLERELARRRGSGCPAARAGALGARH